MFGYAMATPEQDVPLDHSGDEPTLPARLRIPLPKGLLVELLGSGSGTNGVYMGEAEPASSSGSVRGVGGTHSWARPS